MAEGFAKVGHFKDVGAFEQRLRDLAIDLPCDAQVMSEAEGSPLAVPIDVGGFVVGNRWCIHPMEGWDGTTTCESTDHTPISLSAHTNFTSMLPTRSTPTRFSARSCASS